MVLIWVSLVGFDVGYVMLVINDCVGCCLAYVWFAYVVLFSGVSLGDLSWCLV